MLVEREYATRLLLRASKSAVRSCLTIASHDLRSASAANFDIASHRGRRTDAITNLLLMEEKRFGGKKYLMARARERSSPNSLEHKKKKGSKPQPPLFHSFILFCKGGLHNFSRSAIPIPSPSYSHYVEVIIGYHIEIAEQGLRTHCSEGKRRVWQFGHNNLSLDTEEEMGGAKSDAENGLSNKTNFRVARNYSPSVTKE